MASLGSLVVWLEANITKFDEGTSKAAYLAEKRAKEIDKSISKITGTLKGLAAAAGIGLSLNQLWGTFNKVTDVEAKLLKMASRVNTTVEDLSSLGVMARKTGMDADSFYMAIEKGNRTISNAVLKTEALAGAVDEFGEPLEQGARVMGELGLRAEVLNTLPLPQKLMAISDALRANVAPADQSRIILEMYGRAAGGLVIPLKEGGEAIEKLIARQRELGVITDDMAKRGAAAKTAAGDLSVAWGHFAYEMSDVVAPALAKVLNFLTRLITIKSTPPALDFMEYGIMGQGPGEWPGDPNQAFRGRGATGGWYYEKDVRIPPVRPTPKLGGGGKAAKEMAFTEVTPFERAMWGAEDAERLFKEAEELLGRLVNDQERLVKGQQSYASEMASLSPLLADQIRYKEEALLLEDKAARLALDRELDEKKIGEAVYAQELHFRDLLTEAKKLSLEREKWAGQGWAGGLKMGAWELAKGSEDWRAREMAAWVKGFPKEASTFLARNFIEGIKTGKMDLQETFISLGYSTAEVMIQKFLEGWLIDVVPLVSDTFANIFSGGGGGGFGSFLSFLIGIFGGGSSPVSAQYWHQGSGGPIAAAVYGHQGLAPNEYLAVLLGSERVLSPQETAAYDAGMRRGGGGGGYSPAPVVNLTIEDHVGVKAKVEPQSDGGLRITLENIDDMMAGAYGRQGSFYKAINHNRKMTR
jgi:hypothetical protein